MSAVHLTTLLLSFAGFSALALATERYAKHLLRKVPSARWRRGARISGWALLTAALTLSIYSLETYGVGIVFWIGWLSVAALALVFAMPKWPWQPPVKATPVRAPRTKPGAVDITPTKPARRLVGWALLAVTLAVFGVGLSRVESKPLHRDDALHGKVGPWEFTFAEVNRDPPEIVDMNVPIKDYQLSFCESCDLEIRHAYLKVNRPRSERSRGVSFEGNNWARNAEIQMPANLTKASELWLTVVGKNGAVHQISWPMSEASPATVAWFERQGEIR